MKTQVKNGVMTFGITAKLAESGVRFAFADDADQTLHNKFNVRVKVGKKSRSFNFFGSQADYEQGKEKLDDTDLKEAFRAFISDAESATESFADFCGNFGYNEDSRRAEKTYKACKKSLKKLNALGITESDLYNILEALRAEGIE
jgi:hypothetical protein